MVEDEETDRAEDCGSNCHVPLLKILGVREPQRPLRPIPGSDLGLRQVRSESQRMAQGEATNRTDVEVMQCNGI